MVIAGTSAQTSLPWHVFQLAAAAGAPLVDVHLEADRSVTSPPAPAA